MTKKNPTAGPPTPALAPEIRSGQSVELLKELHVLTREGKLNQDSRRKLKHVYHHSHSLTLYSHSLTQSIILSHFITS